MTRIRDNQGMTLVELLLAMAILAVLLGAAARVLHALHTSSQIVVSEGLQEDQRAGLRNFLKMDCAHAESLQAMPAGISITSQAYLEETTHQVKHLPATITYEILSIDGRHWLLRRQRPAGSQKKFADVVCRDVAGMEVEMLYSTEPEASATTQPTTSPSDEKPEITLRSNEAVITIRFTDGSEALTLHCFTP